MINFDEKLNSYHKYDYSTSSKASDCWFFIIKPWLQRPVRVYSQSNRSPGRRFYGNHCLVSVYQCLTESALTSSFIRSLLLPGPAQHTGAM